jgi:hypothetical protein
MTHGTFSRVDPTNIAGINLLMKNIVASILQSTLPASIQVTNSSLAPPQVSHSTTLTQNPDGSVSLALDSIIGLKLGNNDIQVKINVNASTVRDYSFKIQADGPEATASTSELTCYDPPALTLLNAQGKADTAYPAGSNAYQVKLTVPGTDLGKATVTSISLDSTKGPAWGDSETTVMNGTGGAFQGPLTLNGSATSITENNGTLEGDAIGKVILSWVHPRDPRQAATYALPGARIPVIPPFIEVERVRDVTRGEASGGTIQDPVVIYGGAGLDYSKPDSLRLTYGGCLSNCAGEAIRLGDPAQIPGFVFKTASPFSYTVKLFDHLGNFVNEAQGAVDAAKWQAMPRQGDSVAVVMSVLPVAKNGAKVGSGVYLLRAVINSQPSSTHDAKGNLKTVAGDSRSFLNRFGYIRGRR